MRILMICPQFRPLTGGYERAAERLSAALAARGHVVTVITERRDRRWPGRENQAGVQIRRLWCVYRRGVHVMTSLCAFAFWLLRHGRSHQVWHVHQYGAHASLAVLLGKLLRRPVVLKLTSSGAQGLARALGEGTAPGLQRWAHRHVDACVALTDEMRQEALAFGIQAGRVFGIGNAVDTDEFTPSSAGARIGLRARLGLPARPMVMCVGRLAEEKNHLGLLDAWAQVQRQSAANWLLVLVGEGPLRRRIEQRIQELGLGDAVILVGESANVKDWLSAADVFVLASHNEGMANTVLEAQSSGLPCVVTAVSGMRQLVGDCAAGRVVPVGDAQAMAGGLLDVIRTTSEERLVMGQRGRGMVLENYALPVVVARYVELYRGLDNPRGVA